MPQEEKDFVCACFVHLLPLPEALSRWTIIEGLAKCKEILKEIGLNYSPFKCLPGQAAAAAAYERIPNERKS